MYLQRRSADAQPLPRKWVDALFRRFKVLYGAAWLQKFGSVGLSMDELAEEWSAELAGLSGPEIARGLEACRTLKFPPSLPEFLALCRPPVDAHAAFCEAVRNLGARGRGEEVEWSTPAIFWTALAVGQFEVLSSSYPAIRTRWERELEAQLAKPTVEPIPPVAKALPAPPGKPNPEALRMLRDLGEQLRQRTARALSE